MSIQSSKRARARGAISLSVLFLLGAGLIYWFGEIWLRNLLLYLSTAEWARRLVSGLPLANRVAARFVAGETVDDAVRVARELNLRGMRVTMDLLGESVSNPQEALAARDEILRLFERIDEEQLTATVSVKLSQLGLKLDPELAFRNVRELALCAKEHNNRLRIDMEDSEVVETTLEIFDRLRFADGLDNIGIVIQAYLYRSESDVRKLIEEGASVRLCKGAYKEPAHVAFPVKEDTDSSFVDLMQMMLAEDALANGVYLGVASHDEQMIEATKSFARQNQVAPSDFEFQMLYGIRRDLQEALIADGYQVRVYVPYGTAWYPYFVRRLAERPANLWFFLSNLIRN